MKLKGNEELETRQDYDAEGPQATSRKPKEALIVKKKKVKNEEDSEESPPASTKPKKKLTKVKKN